MKKISADLIVKLLQKVIGKGSHNLHEPYLKGNESNYLKKTIKSNFVSSVGKYVDLFEKKICHYTNSKFAIAVVNGTQAIFVSLKVCGVKQNNEVLVPALTFVGTVNAISYLGAIPHFIDSKIDDFGVDCQKLENYLKKITKFKNGNCINKSSGNVIKAIIPVHIFGHPCKIEKIKKIAKKFNLIVIEDAAEALGSFYKKKHLGTFGEVGCLSFNGNKIITTGGGGMIITKNKLIAKKIKHITTTAKVKHKWEYIHDEIGYNFRMPNLNAALGLAQMESLNKFLKAKKQLFEKYFKVFSKINGISLFKEPSLSSSNYWLQTLVLSKNNIKLREKILKKCHKNSIKARPVWRLISELKPYKKNPKMNLSGSKEIYNRAINIPSSPGLILK
jgi:perosamine synthetase